MLGIVKHCNGEDGFNEFCIVVRSDWKYPGRLTVFLVFLYDLCRVCEHEFMCHSMIMHQLFRLIST